MQKTKSELTFFHFLMLNLMSSLSGTNTRSFYSFFSVTDCYKVLYFQQKLLKRIDDKDKQQPVYVPYSKRHGPEQVIGPIQPHI